jgi:hypothetical protein
MLVFDLTAVQKQMLKAAENKTEKAREQHVNPNVNPLSALSSPPTDSEKAFLAALGIPVSGPLAPAMAPEMMTGVLVANSRLFKAALAGGEKLLREGISQFERGFAPATSATVIEGFNQSRSEAHKELGARARGV